ncbi:hypothetical protein [Dickeya zeae]|uniref:hypothetical protein n=1 Tax=Dickeya zeae TaxID=204042 RepID=UPI0003192EC4|nr:hypothetical protein [Dickeya zeae]AJC68379.1 hypothetical protein W909_07040 [Dickeya zeae EC1]
MEIFSSKKNTIEPKLKPAESHNRINNLCKIIAKKDYIILPSQMTQSRLPAEDEDMLDDGTDWNKSSS